MATLYLHVGTPKTGTTAIQYFCVANKGILAKYGYCYPVFPYGEATSAHRNGIFVRALCPNGEGEFSDPRQRIQWRRRWDYVAKLFAKYPNVILSDEAIFRKACFAVPQLWEQIRREADARGFDVRIVIYLRRQDQYLESSWAQWIKASLDGKGSRRFDELLADEQEGAALDYHSYLEKPASVFGRDHIIVRVYDRTRFASEGGDICPDFLQALGLPLDAGYAPLRQNMNPTYNGDLLEIRRILNAVFKGQRKALRFYTEVASYYYSHDDRQLRYSMFSTEDRAEFLARYEESNRRLARDYFGDESLRLFSPPGGEPPLWRPNASELCESMIRFLATEKLLRLRQRQELRSGRRLKRWLRNERNGWKRRARTIADYLLER